MVAVALAVASIPEGLPAIVTVSLALGVQRMSKNNAIVRRLSSVETLGRVSVICTDKTGTLTQNKMVVKKIYAGLKEFTKYNEILSNNDMQVLRYVQNDKIIAGIKHLSPKVFEGNLALKILLEGAILCNDAYYQDKLNNKIAGDPTEGALIELGTIFSLDKETFEEKLPRNFEVPFDSIRKMMTTVHKLQQESMSPSLKDFEKFFSGKNLKTKAPNYILYSKGAPEAIIGKCTKIVKNNIVEDLKPEDADKIKEINSNLANKAMRNLAFAFKFLDNPPDKHNIKELENDLIFTGIVGMIDPPRPEVFDAVKKCKMADIRIIMVTGDHKLTAKAIGEELGILNPDDLVIDDEDYNNLSKEMLQKQIENIKVFARVSPEHKVEIVEALKKNNHIVAMTGDGVNDAPSLKQADIGLAMGITGTDVSKEASDIVLTDDNFATIVKAIKEGRVIYDNLKKFILFLLSCNISEVLLMFIAIIFGSLIFGLMGIESSLLYIPLLPTQILWMNLITDGFPAFALGVDLAEKDIMERKASKRREQIFDKKRLVSVFYQGLILTIGPLFIYFMGPSLFNTHHFINDREVFQTCVFTTLVLTQLFHAYNFRFEKRGIFRKGIFGNKILNFSVSASILLQLAIIYIPFLQNIFKTAALNPFQWLIILACSIAPIIVINTINEIIYFKDRHDGRR